MADIANRRGSSAREIPGLVPVLQDLNDGFSRFESVASDVDASPQVVPLLGIGGDFVAWMERGKLATGPLADSVKRDATGLIAPEISSSGDFVPVVSLGGDIVLWMQGGKLTGPGINDDPLPVSTPVATDGKSLWRVHDKLARAKNGNPVRTKISFVGDSWTEMKTIPEALQSMLDGLGYAVSNAPGWVGVNSDASVNGCLGGATFTRSAGWTFIDGNSGSAAWPYGAGIDGNCLWTNTATQTATLGNANATSFTIYYWNAGGSFRYSVDGAAPVVVNTTNAGTLGRVSVSGLSSAPHTVAIDTTGNSGIVSILGIYATSPNEMAVEVIKWGNSGTYGQALERYLPYIDPILADIAPDLSIVILGTNDKRLPQSPPSVFGNALTGLLGAIRGVNPNAGAILVAPPQSSHQDEITPLTSYRDTMYSVAVQEGFDFLSAYDLWPDFPPSEAAGLWVDIRHLSDDGANLLVSQISNQILKL